MIYRTFKKGRILKLPEIKQSHILLHVYIFKYMSAKYNFGYIMRMIGYSACI